jgi:RimJ/RimL family protein N-acetyltransferase
MRLETVYGHPQAKDILFKLLKEREPHQSISHRKMPDWEQHCEFVDSRPYPFWYLIEVDDTYLGAVYLTGNREIGIAVLKKHRGKGYAKQAIAQLRRVHPGQVLANINPNNKESRRMFEKLGFSLLQVTYRAE